MHFERFFGDINARYSARISRASRLRRVPPCRACGANKKTAEEETEEALSSEVLGEIFGEGGELSVKMKGKITEFEFTSEPVSEEVLETMRTVYGNYIEEIESYSVTYTVELSYEVSMKAGEDSDAALDASGEQTIEDQKQSGYVYKIDGKWYIAISPASESA